MHWFGVKRTVKLGIKSLWMHRLRSALTTLGIIFGVCSVIAMLAIGEGASQEAQEAIARLGSTNLLVETVEPPQERADTGERQEIRSYSRDRSGSTISETQGGDKNRRYHSLVHGGFAYSHGSWAVFEQY